MVIISSLRGYGELRAAVPSAFVSFSRPGATPEPVLPDRQNKARSASSTTLRPEPLLRKPSAAGVLPG
jgi:hypothetical protein